MMGIFWGKETEIRFDSDKNSRSENIVEQKQETKKKELNISYGFEKDGYIYLYRVNILVKGDGKNYTKIITIKGERKRYWCLKKKEMTEVVRKHEGKDL